jgi:hypothetical protein
MVGGDLLDGDMTAKLLQRLRFGFHRFFTRNRLVRSLPVATQLQVYRSTTVVAIEYLRCLLCLSARDNTALDAETRRAARAITGHPTGTSNVLMAAVTGLLPAEAVCLRERERLWQHFHLTPFRDDVAVRLFEALQREPRSRASTSGRLANWAHVVERYRQRAREAGVVFDPPVCYRDITRSAAVVARSRAFLTARMQLGKVRPDGNDGGGDGDGSYDGGDGNAPAADTVAGAFTLPPPSRGSARHAAALFHGLRADGATAHAAATTLGLRYGSTPVSIVGPGCSGSLLRLITQ